MLFGLDGVELSLIIVFATLFMSILSGYPVAFALSGSAIISFILIAIGSEMGWLLVEFEGEVYPLLAVHNQIFDEPAWIKGLDVLALWGINSFSRAFGENQNDTLLAVPLFVLMGIALERSKIAEELLTSMGRLFGGMPGGLAVSVVLVGALLAASTGIVGATVVTMGLISLPTMLRAGYSKELSTGVIATSGTLGQIIPPSIVLVLLGSMVGDIYSAAQKKRSQELGIPLPELLGDNIAISTGTLFKAAFIPGIVLALLYAAYALGFALLRPKSAPPINQNDDGNRYDLLADYGRSVGRAAGAIAIPTLAFIGIWISAAFIGLSGSQQPPEDALEFSSAQAMLEEIERARPSGAMSDADFADLQAYTALMSRGKPVPEDLQVRMDEILGDLTGQDLVAKLRETEFSERKAVLIRSVSRFALSMDAMLGPDVAKLFTDVLQRVEAAETLDGLTEAVRGAPRGQAVQALVNRADREFDFAPYELAAEDYASTLSKLRRKSVIRKFKDDPDGAAAEQATRSQVLTIKIGALLDLYGPYFDAETRAGFDGNLVAISEAEDLETQLNAIRELPASGDFDRAVGNVNSLLEREAYLAASFAYDRTVRQVARGQVPFGIAVPLSSDAANLLRQSYPDLGSGEGPKQLSAYFRDSLTTYRVPPVSMGVSAFLVIASMALALAAALRPRETQLPLLIGALGVIAFLAAAVYWVTPATDPWLRTMIYAVPAILIIYGLVGAVPRLLEVEVIRVVVPPVVLIVAVLGSIFGGITNPTPAAALGAGGAMLLSAIKLLERSEQVGPFDNRIGRNLLLWTAASIAVMLLVKTNFLDGGQSQGLGRGVASSFAGLLYVFSILGMIYAAMVLLSARVDRRVVPNPRTIRGAVGSYLFSRDRVLTSILMETAKVSVMVFAILIGSQLLALTLRSFGGEEYIEHFLRSFEDPRTLLLVVMIVLFILGFVLDFIEIIFIVIPIVGPVVYGADPNIMHPAWITILIAVNLQTSFITPPFGFALFYLRGVAPPEIQTSHIYRGIVPFVIIQVVGLTILWFFPQITTFLPELLPEN
jgi:TRAP-type mannitol/chloroaromatic compound transport system permease large subunit